MKNEEETRSMLEDHQSINIKEMLPKMKEAFPELSDDYWKGYHQGITNGYKMVLEEFEEEHEFNLD